MQLLNNSLSILKQELNSKGLESLPVIRQQVGSNIVLKCGKNKDCTVLYDNKDAIVVENDQLKLLMTGCWGVYGKEGETQFISPSYKSGKLVEKTEKVVFGAQSVANGMIMQGEVDGVILAGDNVYTRSIAENEIADINKEFLTFQKEEDQELFMQKIKAELHNFLEQYELGFKKLIKNVKTKNFLVAVGNHDAKTCLNLTQEMDPKLKSDGWIFPALSYTQMFMLRNGMKVNLVFIDTNVYDFDDGEIATLCSEYGVEDDGSLSRTSYGYTASFRKNQMAWVKQVLRENAWNILIGHIPPKMAPHKQKQSSLNKPFYDDLAELQREIAPTNKKIHLYLCADEHNQQFVSDKIIPPIAIVGSGGNQLDPIYSSLLENKETVLYYAKKVHGFVSLDITGSSIELVFFQTPPGGILQRGCSISIDKVGNALVKEKCEVE